MCFLCGRVVFSKGVDVRVLFSKVQIVFYVVGLSFLRVLMLGCSFLRLRLNLRKGCAIVSTSLFHRLLIIAPFLAFGKATMTLATSIYTYADTDAKWCCGSPSG